MLRDSPHHPATAAPSPGLYSAAFDELADYRRVFVLPISSKVSASHRAALAAAGDDPRVTVLDGLSVSAGHAASGRGHPAPAGAGRRAVEQVQAWLDAARRDLGLLIALDTLEYLRRGGRIGARPQGRRDGARRAPAAHPARRRAGRVRAGVRPPGGVGGLRAVSARAGAGGRRRAGGDRPRRLAGGRPAAGRAWWPGCARRRRSNTWCELGAAVGTHGGPGALGLAVLVPPAP